MVCVGNGRVYFRKGIIDVIIIDRTNDAAVLHGLIKKRKRKNESRTDLHRMFGTRCLLH